MPRQRRRLGVSFFNTETLRRARRSTNLPLRIKLRYWLPGKFWAISSTSFGRSEINRKLNESQIFDFRKFERSFNVWFRYCCSCFSGRDVDNAWFTWNYRLLYFLITFSAAKWGQLGDHLSVHITIWCCTALFSGGPFQKILTCFGTFLSVNLHGNVALSCEWVYWCSVFVQYFNYFSFPHVLFRFK